MSQQHYCADGTHTFTGRNTTPEQRALVCVNNGGEVDANGNPISPPTPPTPVMNPNYVPPHLLPNFNPDDPKYDTYVVPPAIMKDTNGNDVPGNEPQV